MNKIPVFQYPFQFIYPTARVFSFDEVVSKIVQALEARNWKVPGIKVTFDTYGSGEEKYQLVRDISGIDFNLHFSRGQGSPGPEYYFNKNAAVTTIKVPKEILTVHDDQSGSYYLYVGTDWEADRDEFFNGSKVHPKMYKEPRRYLHYNRRGELLVHTNDAGRQYDPITEPKTFHLAYIAQDMAIWLNINVLQEILKFPEVKERDVISPFEPLVEYKGPFPLIFSTCKWDEAERICNGKRDPLKLKPYQRHASFSSYPRLSSIGARFDDIPTLRLAYDGFIWCDPNQEISKVSTFKDLSRYLNVSSSDDKIVAIRLKYSNGVYVTDRQVFEDARTDTFERIKREDLPRDRMTNMELDRCIAIGGTSLVPISEYRGNFQLPIVLINRELDFDEIEWMVEGNPERRR